MEDMDVLEAVYDSGKNRAMVRDFQPDLEAEMKQWKEESMGVDELLAHAGYNVRASDLTHVAQRIEELDSILGAAPDLLASDTVHYNPSDLVSWIEGMLDEVGPVAMPPPPPPQPNHSSSSEMESVVTTVTPLELSGMPPEAFQGYAPFNPSALYEMEQMDLGKGDAMVNPSHSLQQQQPRPSSSSSSSCLVPQRHAGVMTGSAGGIPVTPCGISGTVGGVPPVTCGTVLMPTMHESDELTGVRLVHLLLACANAVQRGDLAAAIEMVQQLRLLVSHPSSSVSAMARVATQFVEALSRRIQNGHIGAADAFQQSQQHQAQQLQSQQQQQQQQPAMMIKDEGSGDPSGSAMDEILHFHFYETCPYLKFAHFTANQAILEALEGHKCVHVVDLNLQYGLQWPALIQALALRPGGPPTLRLTGIGPPQPRRNDLLQEIGLKLAQLAETVNVDFAFHGVVAARLDDVQPWMLTVRRGEAVAVNSVFQMHKVLGESSEGGTPGGTARRAAIDEVLRLVRSLKPKIVTLVEQDADHNGPVFMERFMAALHYYSTMFDSLEACNLAPGSVEQMVAETYLGREIGNIVACEGAARTERHETLSQWRIRMARAGFQPLYLGSNAFKQASMLLTLFSGDGYRVEEKDGCLTLGWHSRPLVAASAWECV